MSAITIMMYHYIRPVADSAWPRIKGMEVAAFERQLDYIQVHYNVVSFAQIIASRQGGEALPPRPLMLSFDDGYYDHFAHALPAMRARGMCGVFFPSTSTVYERDMLDVNKIQFVLASLTSAELLADVIDESIRDAVGLEGLESVEAYRHQYAVANDFDSATVIYVKRMLQHALPENMRSTLINELFKQHVSEDSRGFADEIYMSLDDLSRMADAGMEIGSHAHQHEWLNRHSAREQEDNIVQSLCLFDDLGLPRTGFTFCYPYGAYNDETLAILKRLGCAGALTSRRELGDLDASLLELSRLDAVDLPCARNAPKNAWTRKCCEHI